MQKVLIAEDERNVRLTLELCLEGAGFEVISAEDGIKALQLATERKPDVILLDLVLPGMSGFLVLEAIRSEPSSKDIPVIIISAKAQDDDIRRARQLGANDYLVKPFTPGKLLQVVKSNLDKGA